jgi:RNA polymerase subunit RPABC4/transcription elongation factor Spt4
VKEGDKVCRFCSTVVIDAGEKEKCRVCGKEMEPYKKEEKKEEVKVEHP